LTAGASSGSCNPSVTGGSLDRGGPPSPGIQRRLLETIDHEFRTPLAALLGHVELIHDQRRRRYDLDEDLATWLDATERAGWRLRDLVEEVSGLAESEELV
jgi:signal transduction histidine kinase